MNGHQASWQPLSRGRTSTIFTDAGKTRIKKVYLPEPGAGTAPISTSSREIYLIEKTALKQIAGNRRLPHAVQFDDESMTITMDYSGNTLTKGNAPPDFVAQLKAVEEILVSHDVIYADLRRNNIVVANGDITLVDFGLAFVKGTDYPFDNPFYGKLCSRQSGFSPREVRKLFDEIGVSDPQGLFSR